MLKALVERLRGRVGLGAAGERTAARYLAAVGYRIVARNVRVRLGLSPKGRRLWGEVDIVAYDGGTLAFVEVKTRKTLGELGLALEAVNTRRIARAAQHYVARHPGLAAAHLRFDVIFLAPWAWPRHVKGAFDASQE